MVQYTVVSVDLLRYPLRGGNMDNRKLGMTIGVGALATAALGAYFLLRDSSAVKEDADTWQPRPMPPTPPKQPVAYQEQPQWPYRPTHYSSWDPDIVYLGLSAEDQIASKRG